jgi:hypothetical protein
MLLRNGACRQNRLQDRISIRGLFEQYFIPNKPTAGSTGALGVLPGSPDGWFDAGAGRSDRIGSLD